MTADQSRPKHRLVLGGLAVLAAAALVACGGGGGGDEGAGPIVYNHELKDGVSRVTVFIRHDDAHRVDARRRVSVRTTHRAAATRLTDGCRQ